MEQKITIMTHRIAYLIKLYNIPTYLVVNKNLIRIHLVTIKKDQTWETIGVKHVQVLRIIDKRQNMSIISSSTNGLPLQVVFKGTTSHTFPHELGRKTLY
jgi:hypothetical protein